MARNQQKYHLVIATVLAACFSTPAMAWDEDGHIAVTRIAHRIMPERIPAWVKSPEIRMQLEYLSAEPDRWRGQNASDLEHTNNPDHYFDVEQIADYGLTMKTLPTFRRQFTDVLAAARAKNPDLLKDYIAAKDRDYTRLVPGLLPYQIAELQWKVASSWTTLRTYEQYREYVTDDMIEFARANVVFHMGILSHYVGDGSQPLHTTHHHNGWVGENPKGYTTDKKFHSFLDGGLMDIHHVTPESMASLKATPRTVTPKGYFGEICAYIEETHQHVIPLYEMEKSGELRKAPGKPFVEARLVAGGEMLAGVWTAAYDGSKIDDFRVKRLLAKGKVKDRKGAGTVHSPD